MDFEHWQEVAFQQKSGVTVQQGILLHELDNLLSMMSGKADKSLWTDEALRTSQQWVTVRELAQKVLTVFDWELETPPSNRPVYIPSKEAG